MFWLDLGVDGFRYDVVNFLSKEPGLPDGWQPTGAGYADGSPHYSCGPRIHQYVAELTGAITAGRSRTLLSVGEMPGVTVEEAIRFTDPRNAELDVVFQFEHVDLDHRGHKFDPAEFDLRDLKATFRRWQEGLSEVGWNSLYWNNHDQPRVVSRFGDDTLHRVESAKMLATMLHLHRGTP